MGHNVALTASDGHRLAAHLAAPAGKPRGGIVVVQEIFGLTGHIRNVVDQYAAAGYLAIAPALFDRVERDVDVAYTDMTRALGYMKSMNVETVMLDLQAALDEVHSAGRTGVVGYCWGGTMAYLAAARLGIDAAIAYYGGGIVNYLAEKPRVPVMFHFGDKDTHIPAADIERIERAFPAGVYHRYPAEHGFNCTDRSSYDPASSRLAFERSIEFLHQNVG